jgi:hypothetical protein
VRAAEQPPRDQHTQDRQHRREDAGKILRKHCQLRIPGPGEHGKGDGRREGGQARAVAATAIGDLGAAVRAENGSGHESGGAHQLAGDAPQGARTRLGAVPGGG